MSVNSSAFQAYSVSDILPMAEAFIPLASLAPSFLRHLLEQSDVDYICQGQYLFERGVCDGRHIYLLSGRVQYQFASGFRETISARDTLYSLANEMPRPCSALADTDCIILTIDSDKLDRILSWSQIAQYLLTELSSERDMDEDIEWIKTVLNSNLFFKVPPVNAERILDKMHIETVLANEVIVREGEIGNCCYFIKEGSAKVLVHEGHSTKELATIGVGRCFGEDALVYETVRNATVRMASDGVLMRLDKDAFKLLLLEPKIEEVTEHDCQDLLEPPVFIDVRTQEEYEEGHLALSANVPLSLLSLKRRLLRAHIPYVFYCDTGRRSRAAAYLLGKQGYNAVALSGGLIGAGMQYQLVTDNDVLLKDGRIEQQSQ